MTATMNVVDQHGLSQRMCNALRVLRDKDPKSVTVGWKNTPHIIASGTAQALVDRGLARYAHTIEDLARGTSGRIAFTDLGREVAGRL